MNEGQEQENGVAALASKEGEVFREEAGSSKEKQGCLAQLEPTNIWTLRCETKTSHHLRGILGSSVLKGRYNLFTPVTDLAELQCSYTHGSRQRGHTPPTPDPPDGRSLTASLLVKSTWFWEADKGPRN